jgi:transglutaminase-like putative cysteine protease
MPRLCKRLAELAAGETAPEFDNIAQLAAAERAIRSQNG